MFGKILLCIGLFLSPLSNPCSLIGVRGLEGSFDDSYDRGMTALDESRFQDAKQAFDAAYTLSGTNAHRRMCVLIAIAHLYEKEGNFDQAEQLLLETATIMERTPGFSANLTGSIYLKLAGLSYQANRPEAIERYSKKSIALFKSTGNNTFELPIALNNLAWSEVRQGKLAGAELHFRQALDLIAKGVGRNSITYGSTANNLASVCVKRGKITEACSWYERSLSALRSVLANDHELVQRVLADYTRVSEQRNRPGPPGGVHRKTPLLRQDRKNNDLLPLFEGSGKSVS